MKKLLTLFGSLGLVASTAVVSVACKTPSQEKNTNESDKAKEKEKLATTLSTVVKKETKKVKSHEEAASDLTKELFSIMGSSNQKNQLKKTNATEEVLKKQKDKADGAVSISRAPRNINDKSNSSLVSGWLNSLNK
ncbi:lipoprotein [Mycoplasma capricolum]|uniref:lipoprotein n=1 Tax=Mycoplasma capricolum TaxID=2095 RepID=UPI003DA45571